MLKTSDQCDACEAAQACELSFAGFGRRRVFWGRHSHLPLSGGTEAVARPGERARRGQGPGHRRRWHALPGLVRSRDGRTGGTERLGGPRGERVIRDRVEIDAMDFGVKALGTVPRRADKAGGGERDIAVTFGGVTVIPGHRVVADDDGVIVLPAGVTEPAIDVAGAVAATSEYVRQGSRG